MSTTALSWCFYAGVPAAVIAGIAGLIFMERLACQIGAALASLTAILGLALGGPAIVGFAWHEVFRGPDAPVPQQAATGAVLLVLAAFGYAAFWALDGRGGGKAKG